MTCYLFQSICLVCFFFNSLFVLKSFTRRFLLKESFGRLFLKTREGKWEVKWRCQKLNDAFKLTDNIISYYCYLVDCQRTSILQTSNVINSESQIWITSLYMDSTGRRKIWSGGGKNIFAQLPLILNRV